MKKAIIFFLLFMTAQMSQAATITSVLSGNWTVASTWDLNRVPIAGDIIIIPNPLTVTIPNFVFAVIQSSSSILEIYGNLALAGNNCDLQLRTGSLINVHPGGAIITPNCDPDPEIFIRMCHPDPANPSCLFSGAELCALSGTSYQLTSSGIGVLPVELVQFEALQRNETVKLFWLTASEQNNSGFEVQGSKNGLSWNKLGFVTGNGTTQQQNSYEFTDLNPTFGNNYYRLKQIDFDGKFKFSEVAVVNFSTDEIIVYPNPIKAGEQFSVFGMESDVEIEVSFYDAAGRFVFIEKNNPFQLPYLTAGVYWAKLLLQGKTVTYKVAVVP